MNEDKTNIPPEVQEKDTLASTMCMILQVLREIRDTLNRETGTPAIADAPLPTPSAHTGVGPPTNIYTPDTNVAGNQIIWYAISSIDPETFDESAATPHCVLDVEDPEKIPLVIKWEAVDTVEFYRIYKYDKCFGYGLIGQVRTHNPLAVKSIEFTDTGYTPNVSLCPVLTLDIADALRASFEKSSRKMS